MKTAISEGFLARARIPKLVSVSVLNLLLVVILIGLPS